MRFRFRSGYSSPGNDPIISFADDLQGGADAIAGFLFRGRKNHCKIYRLVQTGRLPFADSVQPCTPEKAALCPGLNAMSLRRPTQELDNHAHVRFVISQMNDTDEQANGRLSVLADLDRCVPS